MQALHTCLYMSSPRDQKSMMVELHMTNYAEVHWKRDPTRYSTRNWYAKTYLGYFERAFGFVGGVSMCSSGVKGIWM